MGKHSRSVPCSVCNGTGKTQHSLDGTTVEVDCVVCDGTGKQPWAPSSPGQARVSANM